MLYSKISQINASLKLLIIADCHHLKEDEIQKVKNLEYDICILLGDINGNYLDMILKYVPNEKIYGILGNHDEFGVLESRNIKNIHEKIITVKGIKILGFQGSSRYKTGEYPMFTQKESINLLKNVSQQIYLYLTMHRLNYTVSQMIWHIVD